MSLIFIWKQWSHVLCAFRYRSRFKLPTQRTVCQIILPRLSSPFRFKLITANPSRMSLIILSYADIKDLRHTSGLGQSSPVVPTCRQLWTVFFCHRRSFQVCSAARQWKIHSQCDDYAIVATPNPAFLSPQEDVAGMPYDDSCMCSIGNPILERTNLWHGQETTYRCQDVEVFSDRLKAPEAERRNRGQYRHL